jgi:hypothetical protein
MTVRIRTDFRNGERVKHVCYSDTCSIDEEKCAGKQGVSYNVRMSVSHESVIVSVIVSGEVKEIRSGYFP